MDWNTESYAAAVATHDALVADAGAVVPEFLRRHPPTDDGKPISDADLDILAKSSRWTVHPGNEWIYASHDGLSEWHGPEEYEELIPVEYLWDADAGDARLATYRAEATRRREEAEAAAAAREAGQQRERAEAAARCQRDADLAELSRLRALYPDA